MCHSKRESHPSYLFNPINPITLATVSCPHLLAWTLGLQEGFRHCPRQGVGPAPNRWGFQTSQPNNDPSTHHFPPQWCGIQWRPAKTRQAAWEPARRRRLRNRLLKSLSTKCRPEALEKMIGITVCRMVFKPYGRMRFIMQLVINSTCLPFDAHLCLHHSEKGPWLCLAYVFSNVCTRNAPKNYDQTGLLAEIRRQTPHCRGQSVRR